MKLYIAHNYEARRWLSEFIDAFDDAGYQITSRWITEDLELTDIDGAQFDLEDLRNADGLVMMVDRFSERPGRGKYVEYGYALALGKPIILIGSSNDCVFFMLALTRFQTLTQFLSKPQSIWLGNAKSVLP